MAENYFLWIKKSVKTDEIIWKILLDYIRDPEEFDNLWIVEISKKYKICHKSLSNRLKWLFKINKKQKNWKILEINWNIREYLQELTKLQSIFNTHLTNKEVEISKYFLNNLKC